MRWSPTCAGAGRTGGAPAGVGSMAGMALALAGTAGLRASDPALALAVDVPTSSEAEVPRQGWRETARDWWQFERPGIRGRIGLRQLWWAAGSAATAAGTAAAADGGGGGGGCGGGGGGCGGGG